MDRKTFDDYINRFNAQDITAFQSYIDQNAIITNGTLVIKGRQGMIDHYTWIWRSFTEELHVERFVSDDDTLAIQMWAHFTCKKDDTNSPFGKVQAGEAFDYRGVIMYQIVNHKFTDIKVAYLSFTRTGLNGKTVEIGIPH
jgi:hypothetical protein